LRKRQRHNVSRLGALVVALSAAFSTQSCGHAEAPLQFRAQVIAANVEGAYLTSIADLNGDQKPDVILLSIRSEQVFWYENPSWRRHVLASGITLAAVGAAVEGTVGTGDFRLVLLTGFHRDAYEKNRGELVYMDSVGPASKPFIFAREPAAHRAAFADVDGNGTRELVLAPIAGPGPEAPIASLGNTPLLLFNPPGAERYVIKPDLKGTVHGLTIVDWDGDGRDDVVTAGLGGIWLHRSRGGVPSGDLAALTWQSVPLTPGRPSDDPLTRGAGDVRIGKFVDGTRFLAAIESVHGGDVAVYTKDPAGHWVRRVIDRGYELAHGFALADFDGDGGDEIVVSDSRGKGGVFIYDSPGGDGREWQRSTIDETDMAAGACEARDMTGDNRVDLVCAGFPTRNVKLYVNEGEH